MREKLVDWYINRSEEGRVYFWMAALSLFVFLCLCPLFFFYDIQGYSYPLGWLLGSLFSFFSYWSITYQGKNLQNRETKKGSLPFTLLFMGLRFLGYAAILALTGICTFKKEWLAGFDAINFYTAAASLVPMPFILLLLAYFQKGHVSKKAIVDDEAGEEIK